MSNGNQSKPDTPTLNMKTIVITCLLAFAFARPDSYEVPSSSSSRSFNAVGIVRDDRIHPEGGSYSFDVETQDGIVRSESGSPLGNVENTPTGQQGSVAFTFPNGEKFDLKFVADENGYQPQSAWLPVAPEFPHPIPQFVLDQIEKAAREDAGGGVSRSAASPSRRYDYDSDEK